MRFVHLRCMVLKNLGDWRPFCQQSIEFFNIKSRVTELPRTCYSTVILPDSWPNAEKKNKMRTCISDCLEKNTGCLVKYQHFCFKLSWIFSKTMQIIPVNLHEFCKIGTCIIYTRKMFVFSMALRVYVFCFEGLRHYLWMDRIS